MNVILYIRQRCSDTCPEHIGICHATISYGYRHVHAYWGKKRRKTEGRELNERPVERRVGMSLFLQGVRGGVDVSVLELVHGPEMHPSF